MDKHAEYIAQLASMSPDQLQAHFKKLKDQAAATGTTPEKVARISILGERIVVSCPYIPAAIADFKRLIPYNQREYNPTSKEWIFASEHRDTIRRLCKRHFDAVEELEAAMPSQYDTLYGVLNVSRDATPEEIKKAHRKLAIKHHPDRGGNADLFHRVQQAYEVLSDEKRRKRYDAALTFRGA